MLLLPLWVLWRKTAGKVRLKAFIKRSIDVVMLLWLFSHSQFHAAIAEEIGWKPGKRHGTFSI